jgi:uncharacterized protein (DUF488 family)
MTAKRESISRNAASRRRRWPRATVFTIGHSTHPFDEFVTLLKQAGVDLLIDVRTVPRSRANPQFNTDALPKPLAAAEIGYRHIAALGGLRHRRKSDGPSPNGFWQNASFRNYADYAMTAPFRTGLAELETLSRTHRCAIMCAEAVWWRCHRRIIADYLLADGRPVAHIMALGKIEPAKLTSGARQQKDGRLLYLPDDDEDAAPPSPQRRRGR